MNKLIERLQEIAKATGAEKEYDPWSNGPMARLHIDRIRLAADAFVHALDGAMPITERELLAVVWTFGRFLDGNLQKQLDAQLDAADDLLAASPSHQLAVNRWPPK